MSSAGGPPRGHACWCWPEEACRKEAGCHGGRGVGPESNTAGCSRDGRGGSTVGGDHRCPRPRRVDGAGRPDRRVRRPGVRGDRVDERCPVRARPAGAGGLAGRDRRRAEGQGLAPLACKTDKIDAWVLAELSAGTWSRRSGCPPRRCARNGNGPGGGCTWCATAPR